MRIKNIKLSVFIFTIIFVVGFSLCAYGQNVASSDKNIFLDSDQDGLSDEEEKLYGTDHHNSDTDGDGYSDGVEIKGGYDPLKPAPGDKIFVKTEKENISNDALKNENNLTNELSLKIAKLVSERSAEKQEININDLDAIIQSSITKSLTFEDIPEISDDEIKIKKQNYSRLDAESRTQKEKEDTLEYLVSVSYILATNSPQKIDKVNDLDEIASQVVSQVGLISESFSNMNYFADLAKKGNLILDELKEVEVPENMLELHKKGLRLAKYSVKMGEDIKPNYDDPVGTIAHLSKVQGLINLGLEFSHEISTKFASLGITEIPLEL